MFKEAAEASPSLHMTKCHIVGNLMNWLVLFLLIMSEQILLYPHVYICMLIVIILL